MTREGTPKYYMDSMSWDMRKNKFHNMYSMSPLYFRNPKLFIYVYLYTYMYICM
jgi:hypothetical protein